MIKIVVLQNRDVGDRQRGGSPKAETEMWNRFVTIRQS